MPIPEGPKSVTKCAFDQIQYHNVRDSRRVGRKTISRSAGSILSVESNQYVESKAKNVESKTEKMWSPK